MEEDQESLIENHIETIGNYFETIRFSEFLIGKKLQHKDEIRQPVPHPFQKPANPATLIQTSDIPLKDPQLVLIPPIAAKSIFLKENSVSPEVN